MQVSQTEEHINHFLYDQEKFRRLSIQFLIIIILSLFFSYLGIFFLIYFPLIFLFSPYLWYLLFAWIPKVVIKIGKSRVGKILSFLPFINFNGIWLLETQGDRTDLNAWQDFRSFLKEYLTEYAILNTAIIFFFWRLDTVAGLDFSEFNIQSNIFQTFILYNILGMIFVIIKSLQDTEIKIIDADENKRVHRLVDLSYSIKAFFVLYLAISIITSQGFSRGREFELLLSDLTAAMLLGIGIPLFMSFIYLQSPFHKFTVNSLRMWMVDNSEELDLVIGKIEFDILRCNHCGNQQQYPNYFCINCGKDMRTLQSTIFDQPVTIGTLVYLNQNNQFHAKVTNQLEEMISTPWDRNQKLKFGFSVLFPFLFYGGIIVLLIIFFG